MKYRFPYFAPTDGQRINPWRDEPWERARELYEAGQYKEALIAYFDYITQSKTSEYSNTEGTHFRLPHRSFCFDIRLDQDVVSISVPFVRLPQGSTRVAVMRKATEFNGNLALAKLVKQGDELHSVYSCPLKLASPWKLFGVMRDIAGMTNWWADELCLTLGAERLERSPYMTPYSSEITNSIYADIQAIGHRALEAAREAGKDSRYPLGAYLIDVAFTQIDFVASPKEYLAREISVILEDLREDLPPEERYRRATKHMEEFITKPLDQMRPYLYSSPVLFASKSTVTLPELQRNTEELYDRVQGEMIRGDYEFVYTRLTGEVYDILRDCYTHPEVETLLIQSLKDASEAKTLQGAAKCMHDCLHKLQKGELPQKVRNFERGQESAETKGADAFGWLRGLFGK